MVLAMEAREGPTIQEKGECLMEEFSRWFEEGLGSEVVFQFDAGPVHDRTPPPVPFRRYWAIIGTYAGRSDKKHVSVCCGFVGASDSGSLR